MEFTNFKNIAFLIFPILFIFIMITGNRKKENALKYLNLKGDRFVRKIKIFLIGLGGIFLVFALLSPQKLLDNKEIEVKGINIYLLVDTSRSMLGEDLYPDRIGRAKLVMEDIINSLKGDRVGIIPYSDTAYIQMPLTDDYPVTKNYIGALDTQLMSGGGTNLLEGLKLANQSFKEIGDNNNFVIALSDGGDYDKNILEFVEKNKMKVYTIGIGSKKGTTIPNYVNGVKNGFVKDDKGTPVLTKLNSDFLIELAEKSGGKYFEISDNNKKTIDFAQETSKLKTEHSRKEIVKEYEKYFQIPLGLGILLILIGYLLKEVVKDEK